MVLLSKFRAQTFGTKISMFCRSKGRDYRKPISGSGKRVKAMNNPKKRPSLREGRVDRVGSRGEKLFAMKFFMPDTLRGLGFFLGIIPAFALFTINWSKYHSKAYRQALDIASGTLTNVLALMVSATLGLKSLAYGFNIWQGITVEDRVRQAVHSGLGAPVRVVTIIYALYFSHLLTAKEYVFGPVLAILLGSYSSWYTAQVTAEGGFPRWFHSLKTNWMLGQNTVMLLLGATLYSQRRFDRKMADLHSDYQNENLEDKMIHDMNIPQPKY